MKKYDADRSFTDKMHKVAEDIIYPLLHWKTVSLDPDVQQYMDNDDAIDYVVRNDNGDILYVQERFRRSGRYDKYNDITIRYKREHSKYLTEKLSEFYKIHDKVIRDNEHKFYFLYGVSNSSEDNFTKYVVIDLKMLFYLFNKGDICIDEAVNNNKVSKIINNTLYAGIGYNPDLSSSFITLDVKYLNNFDGLVFEQKGFNI